MWHWWVHGRECNKYWRKGRAWWCPFIGTSHTKHLQRMGSLASISLFRVHALWWAGQDTSERVPERPGTCGEKKNVQSKVRTRRWKGDCKLIPFGYGSLKKGYSVIPFLLIQIICYKIIHVFNISKVCSIYIIFLIACNSPERRKAMAGILIVEAAQVLWSNSNFSSNSLVAR